MKILVIEPFYAGSHLSWIQGLQKYSSHELHLLCLKGKYWKWRMQGGAIALASKFKETPFEPDLILASDMLNLPLFLSLCRKQLSSVPCLLYFHENQLTYPWSETDEDLQKGRDQSYSLINYSSALCADALAFNSSFHLSSWLKALPKFLKKFPDHKNLELIDSIQQKSQVLHLALDLKRFDAFRHTDKPSEAVILWNHRWEYDKNPEEFFEALIQLSEKGIPFKLLVLGEQYKRSPSCFETASIRLKKHILHWGFVEDFKEYAYWLWLADITLCTSKQDFFGGSVVEAIYCNCCPLLPKRLAFPEHLPEHLQETHYYTDFETLCLKLEIFISQKDQLRTQSTFPSYVSQYDWGNSIKKYDTFFDALKSTTD